MRSDMFLMQCKLDEKQHGQIKKKKNKKEKIATLKTAAELAVKNITA